MRIAVLIAIVMATSACSSGQIKPEPPKPARELTAEQRLILACHRLEFDKVVAELHRGVNVNGRFGDADPMLFQDPWDLGWPAAADKWTPLIAVANAPDWPDPPRKVKNTVEDLEWAREQQAKIPEQQIVRRRQTAAAIALVLLFHKADINADDGFGATALYDALYGQKRDLAELLIRFDAKVNTKTGVYIDGPGDITPLHRACWSPELTKLLVERGADPNAKDSNGRTPADWRRSWEFVQRRGLPRLR